MAVIVASGILFAVCSRGDLWFDEVLSIQWAKNSKAPTDILSLFRHDNNHPLNTAWLFLLGPGQPSMAYRALGVASGIFSLALIYYIAGILTPRARLAVLIWCASSYAFILYFSEARGYGPAVAFTLAAFSILLKTRGELHALWIPAFWMACALGFLSHATTIYPVAAMGAWVLVGGLRPEKWAARSLVECAAWFLVPAVLAASYFLYFLKPMMVAGGPRYSPVRIAAEFFGYGMGLPVAGAAAWLTITGSVLLIAWAWVYGKFSIPRIRIFFLGALVVFPISGLVMSNAEFLYFRYFLVCLPFIFLLFGGLMERVWDMSPRAWMGVALVIAFCSAIQAPRILALIAYGRGDCRGALRQIGQSPGSPSTVISDHDMMVGMVLEHYRGRAPEASAIRYFPSWVKPADSAGWLITSSQDVSPAPRPPEIRIGNSSYFLKNHFRAAPVSGAHWFLYQQGAAAPSSGM